MRPTRQRVTLQPGEHLLDITKASLTLPLTAYVFFIALPLGLYAFTDHVAYLYATLVILVLGLLHFLHRLQFTWVITNKRTIAQWGMLALHTTSVSHNRITDTSTTTPLFAGILGTGSVRISTASNEDIQITIKAQHDPLRLQHLLNDLKNKATESEL